MKLINGIYFLDSIIMVIQCFGGTVNVWLASNSLSDICSILFKREMICVQYFYNIFTTNPK